MLFSTTHQAFLESQLNETKYWLGFSLIPHIGPVRVRQLKRYFGTLATAWRADSHSLKASGLDDKSLDALIKRRAHLDLDAELQKVAQHHAHVLTMDDEDYPPLLRELNDAPMVLYVIGKIQPQDTQAIAIVGTRKATNYGRDAAFKLSRGLATNGPTIVSGLAQGIDKAAHEGALAANGRTIAVLGCGIQTIYPKQHVSLARKIVEKGALITEFPIGTPPTGINFPRRNRIMSGMSLGVLVVEAPEKSGALITAQEALEQGREVFAVPANIFNAMGRGCNQLIQDGAKLVADVEDVLYELKLTNQQVTTHLKAKQTIPANETEQVILNQLSVDPIHIDELSRLINLPVATVMSTLTILELKGLAKEVGSMQYCRT